MVRSRPRHVPLEGPLGFRHDRTAPPGASWGAGRRGDRLGGKALPGLPRAGGVWGGGGRRFTGQGDGTGLCCLGSPPRCRPRSFPCPAWLAWSPQPASPLAPAAAPTLPPACTPQPTGHPGLDGAGTEALPVGVREHTKQIGLFFSHSLSAAHGDALTVS